MKTVTVKKEQLLATLEENKITHKRDFEIAWQAFHEKAVENLESLLGAAKNKKLGQEINLHVNLLPPEDHSDDYERAIQMLAWEVGDEVELAEHEFSQLVQDEWGWSRQFKTSNMQYTGSESPSKLNLS